MSTRKASAIKLSRAITLLLVKNLNIAPSLYRLEPGIYFVGCLFLNDILTNQICHLFERWNRTSFFLRCRNEILVVVVGDFRVSRPEELPEPQFEELVGAQPA